jgi:glycosyltransferase involved in cell wall biosynthesis
VTTAERPTATPPDSVAVVIPAKDEQDRIATTARAAAALPGVDLVVVVDDGSTDRTAAMAGGADVVVVRHSRNRGKAAAMETGAAVVVAVESREREGTGPRALLFLDADLGATAAKAAPLIDPVLDGTADMTIATLPLQRSAGGGHGFVVRLARDGIERATGWVAAQPLSGQRCLTRPAFAAALPLAHGFGVEVGLTVDLLRQGYRIREVEVPFHHRVTGTDWQSQVHRGRQWLHVAWALATRGVPPVRLPEGLSNPGRGRQH